MEMSWFITPFACYVHRTKDMGARLWLTICECRGGESMVGKKPKKKRATVPVLVLPGCKRLEQCGSVSGIANSMGLRAMSNKGCNSGQCIYCIHRFHRH